MAITVKLYNTALQKLWNGETDYVNDSIVATLHDAGGVFNAAHSVWSDISGSEVSTSDYATYPGETALTSKTVTTAANVMKYDCATINFGTSVVIGAYFLAIRDQTNDVLLWHIDLDGQQLSTTTWQYLPHANGLVETGTNGF